MYRIEMTGELEGSHFITMPYVNAAEVPHYVNAAEVPHCHVWSVAVAVVADKLDEHGMVTDMGLLKGVVARLEGRVWNDIIAEPTMERVAMYIAAACAELLGTRAQVASVIIKHRHGMVAEYYPAVTLFNQKMWQWLPGRSRLRGHESARCFTYCGTVRRVATGPLPRHGSQTLQRYGNAHGTGNGPSTVRYTAPRGYSTARYAVGNGELNKSNRHNKETYERISRHCPVRSGVGSRCTRQA